MPGLDLRNARQAKGGFWSVTAAVLALATLPLPFAQAAGGEASLNGLVSSLDGPASTPFDMMELEVVNAGGGGTVELSAEGFHGTLYEVTATRAAVGGIPFGGEETKVIEHPLAGARFRFRHAGPQLSFLARFEPSAAVNETTIGVVNVSGPVGPSEPPQQLFPVVRPSSNRAGETFDAHREYFSGGPRIQGFGSGLQRFHGFLEFLAAEGTFEVSHSNGTRSVFWAGDRPGSRAIPEETTTLLHVSGDTSNATLAAKNPLVFWWSQGEFPLGPSPITLYNFTGEIRYGGTTRMVDRAVVRLTPDGGRLAFMAPPTSNSGAFDVASSGRFSFISVNGEAWVAAPTFDLNLVASSMGALSLLGLVVWVSTWLRAGAWFPLFSRRTKVTDWSGYVGRTLRNPRRSSLFRLIEDHPGIQPYHLWQKVGGAFGVTLRGLARLERVGLVRSMRVDKYRHYFPAGERWDPERARDQAVLATRPLQETLGALATAGPCTERELARRLQLSHASVHVRLRRLVELGAVRREWAGQRYLYQVSALQALVDASPAVAAQSALGHGTAA